MPELPRPTPRRARHATMIACLIAGLAASGCGDNVPGPGVGPQLEPAQTLIVIAHFDDDMIFMQPELLAAATSGSVTTVYVSSGDPVHGDVRAQHSFEAAMIGYASVAGSSDWDCGYLTLAGSPVHHCRLRDRPISLIGLDTADGGLPGDFPDSPLHLVEGRVPSIPILGPIGGRATVASIVDSLHEIIIATEPAQLHALDLAATHGRDHSGHLFSSAFAFWAAAQAGYAGPIRWHRGYNVEFESPTLGDSDYQAVVPMIGYFEACYFGCGPCGTSCSTLDVDHDKWLRRQYSLTRAPIEARGALALGDSGGCVSLTPQRQLVLGDCATAAQVHLSPGGNLVLGDACLASAPGNYQPLALEPCQDTPSQYWVVDSEGMVWNGRPPEAIPVMNYDHVRCLDAAGAPGAPLIAPICGDNLRPRWHFVER
jgi:hypothetical protein